MSRHETILCTPELRRAMLLLQEFDGYEIDRARSEYRKDSRELPVSKDKRLLVELSGELERCE